MARQLPTLWQATASRIATCDCDAALALAGRGADAGIQVPCESVSIKPHSLPSWRAYPPTAMQLPTAGQVTAPRNACGCAAEASAGRVAVAGVQVRCERVSIKPVEPTWRV